jgi:Mg-chelatase subunit ChlD
MYPVGVSWPDIAISFDRPWFLAVSPLLVAALVSVARCAGIWSRIRAFLRLLAAVAGILALAGMGIERPGAKAKWLVLRDVSGSTRRQNDTVFPLDPELAVQRLFFGDSLAADRSQAVGRGRTRPETALRWAASLTDEIAGVILHTDGQFPGSRWASAGEALGQTRLPVWIVPMVSPPPDARLAGLDLSRLGPDQARAKVTVVSNFSGTGRLKVLAGQEEILDRVVELPAGAPVSMTLTIPALADASLTVVAEVQADDAFPENDQRRAILQSETRKALLLGSAELPAWARQVKIPIVLAQASSSVLPDLQDCAVVLVSGSGLEQIPDALRRRLATYVRTGGGVFLLGAGAHRSPADAEDPINRVLPLAVTPWKRKALEVVVVLDASGSMGRRTTTSEGSAVKFRLAVDAVLSLEKHLTASDALTVLTFSDQAREIYRSDASGIDFSGLARRLAEVEPDGDTDIRPALDLVRKQQPPPGREQLVLVLSDLQTKPFDAGVQARGFGPDAARRLAIAAIAAGEITPGAEGLEQLARRAKGWFVKLDSLRGLEQVFVDFLARQRGQARLEGAWSLQWSHDPWQLTDLALPQVRTVFTSSAKPEAQVLARAGSVEVLGRWRVEMGRAAMLAVDPASSANASFLGDDGLARLVQAAARWAMRPQFGNDIRVDLEREPEELLIRLTRPGVEGDSMEPLEAVVRPLDAQSQPALRLSLAPEAPGQWAATTREVGSGALGVEVRSDEGTLVWQGVSSPAQDEEYARIGPDFSKLQQLARITGGRIVRPWELGRQLRTSYTTRVVPLWPFLAPAALGLMLAEWLLAALHLRRQ